MGPKKGVTAAGRRLEEDWERLVTFYAFPQEHWKHLRTTNVVESPFAAVRLRTGAAKRYKKVENATAVIWKTLLVAEQGFRRLTPRSCCRKWRRGPCTSTESERSGATRRRPPDLFTHLLTRPRFAVPGSILGSIWDGRIRRAGRKPGFSGRPTVAGVLLADIGRLGFPTTTDDAAVSARPHVSATSADRVVSASRSSCRSRRAWRT